MAIFRIGQRARVTNAPAQWQGLIGAESLIESVRESDADVGHFGAACACRAMYRLRGVLILFCGCCLEPIIYDGLEVVAWKTCDWQPRHLREEIDA